MLETNECQGAFNAEPSLGNFSYSPSDFIYLSGKLHNTMEIEILSSKDARFIFHNGILLGVSRNCDQGEFPELKDFKTVRGTGSTHTGALLDGFL